MRAHSSCGSWAELLYGMWNLPGPAIEHVSPALVGRLSPTIPPGKSSLPLLIRTQSYWITAPHL